MSWPSNFGGGLISFIAFIHSKSKVPVTILFWPNDFSGQYVSQGFVE